MLLITAQFRPPSPPGRDEDIMSDIADLQKQLRARLTALRGHL